MGTRSKTEFLQELKSNVPLSVIVTHFQGMRLCGRGKELVGFSPFTREKTPSFTLADKVQAYHDFSSGRSGDIYSYLIEVRKMTPKEAVTFILELSEYKFIPYKFQRKRKKRRRTRKRGT